MGSMGATCGVLTSSSGEVWKSLLEDLRKGKLTAPTDIVDQTTGANVSGWHF